MIPVCYIDESLKFYSSGEITKYDAHYDSLPPLSDDFGVIRYDKIQVTEQLMLCYRLVNVYVTAKGLQKNIRKLIAKHFFKTVYCVWDLNIMYFYNPRDRTWETEIFDYEIVKVQKQPYGLHILTGDNREFECGEYLYEIPNLTEYQSKIEF